MWNNWNPFKRRNEENTNISINQDEGSDGKENTSDISTRGLSALTDSNSRDSGNVVGMNDSRTNGDNNLNNYSSRQTNGHSSVQDNSFMQYSHEDDHLADLSSGGSASTNRHSPRKRSEVMVQQQGYGSPQTMSSQHRSATSPFTQSEKPNLSRDSSMKMKNDNINKSFSGVYGPLLSTPIVPKVRRALESSTGLRSPQTSALARGKSVGRSSSLNYGSGNPTKSTAGQVPWVRLKRRESLTLSDIISGNTPQSPNTVKLAVPEPRFMSTAPSFKMTPVIVTTDHSRVRVVDTQTVVSALREKRKRFGTNQREDLLSGDSWINAAKRRRQDSSQSNASSVSIPSMPESLPNLMGTPGVSLLHIENLKDQRPSTVPAMDAFVSRHQREFGLGGDLSGHKSHHQQVRNHQPHQLEHEQDVRNKQSGKSVLRSIQSSLSSSLRARSSLTALQQSGLDLNRIRQMSDSHEASRTMALSPDVSLLDQSSDEPQSKVPRQALTTAPTVLLERSLTVIIPDKNTGTVPTQIKQKIPEGIILKKHSFSVNSPSNLARPKQMLSLNTLVSTNDFEQDRQKEYKRRVLDLLDEDETVGRSDVTVSATSSTIVTPLTSPVSVSAMTSSPPISIEAAATSAAVSASLDSLNKLVQSATAGMPSSTSASSVASVTSTNTLTQLLKSANDKPAASTVSAPFTTNKDVSFGAFGTSTPSSQNASLGLSAVSLANGGFQLGLSLTTATTVAPTQATSLTTAGGFNMNISTPISSGAHQIIATTPAVPTAFVASTGSGQQPVNTGFNFNSGGVSSSLPNTSIVGGSVFSGGAQTASSAALDVGTKGVNLLSSTVQYPSNSLAFNVSSAPSSMTTEKTDLFQGGNQMFNSSLLQGLSSSSSPGSLSSTLQAFAAARSGDQGSVTKPGINSAQGQGFNFSSLAPSTAATASIAPAPASGLFNFGSSSNSSSLTSGFDFGSTGASTAPGSSFPNASLALSAGNSTAAKLGFNFGATSSANSTSQQQSGGPIFGVASTNPLSSMAIAPTTLSSQGLADHPAGNTFTGFGSNTHATSSTSAFTAGELQPQNMFATATTPALAQSIFMSAAPPYSTSSQTPLANQQQFGATTPSVTFSMFGTSTTTGTNAFAFGQGSSSGVPSKPFTFGLASTQSGATNSFGGPVTAPASLVSPSSVTSVSSTFGSGPTSAFGNSSVSSQFGSIPTTSPPPFGSTVTAPPAFGATAPAFGSTTTSPVFGAMGNQTSSVFGAGVPSGGQSSSVFGAPASSANNLFTFGAASGPQSQPQQTSVFGSNPSTSFGSMPSATGSSVFGAKPSAAVFGAAATNPAPMFDATTQGSTTASSAPFGSSFGMSTSFGAQPVPEKTAFGNTASGFTTSGMSGFGATSQSSGFVSTPQNIFGSSSQNQTPSFGSQPGTLQTGTFGSQTQAGSLQPGTFGSQPNSMQPGTFGSQPSAMQPGTFGSQPNSMHPGTFGSQQNSMQSGTFGSQPSSMQPGTFGSQPSSMQPGTFGSQPSSMQPGTFGSQPSSMQPGTFGSQPGTFGSQPGTFGLQSGSMQPGTFGSQSSSMQPGTFGSQSGSLQTGTFGSQPGSSQAASSFGNVNSSGANMFGAAKPNMFGASTTTQSSFNFGSTQPPPFNSQPPPFNSQTASSGFNFNQTGTQQPAGMGLNFGGAQTPTRPPFQSPAPGGFNFAAAAGSTPSFNFSGTPSTPNPFTPQTPGTVPRPRASVRRPARRGATRR